MRRIPMLLVACALCAGCSAPQKLPSLAALKSPAVASQAVQVSKIVCLWEPGVGRLANGPKRGVLGQILFFTQGSDTPVKVDGSLVVYLFDDHGTIADQSKPIQKVALTREDLGATYVESTLGHSYHIPVPYPKDHGLNTRCTMTIKYTSPDGRTICSDLSSVLLEGASRTSKPMKISRETAPVAKRTADLPADGSSGGETGKADSLVSRVGTTEIHKSEAGKDQLKSLTIRRKTESTVRSPRVEVANKPKRQRFRLANSHSPNAALSTSEDPFAPLESREDPN